MNCVRGCLERSITNASDGFTINSWAQKPVGTRWELCYSSFTDPHMPTCAGELCPDRGSMDCACLNAFHRQCDHYRETVTVARNSLNYTFGGYVRFISRVPVCSSSVLGLIACTSPWFAQADAPWSNNLSAGTSACFIFGLGPRQPQRFGPRSGGGTNYMFAWSSDWPAWGRATDLSMGDNGPPGLDGYCNQGHTYSGSRSQICGGDSIVKHWGATQLEVWRLAMHG